MGKPEPDQRPQPVDTLIVTYNSASYIQSCVASVRRALPEARVHIVDNASSDGTRQILAKMKGCSIRFNDRNEKASPVWNWFLRNAHTEYVLILNPDLQVHRGDFIRHAIRRMDADTQIVGAGRIRRCTLAVVERWVPPVDPGDAAVFFDIIGRGSWLPEQVRQHGAYENIVLDYLDGSCMLLRKAAIARLGGFSDRLPLYFNDTELSIRIHERGLKLLESVRDGDGALTHHVYGSSSRRTRATGLRDALRATGRRVRRALQRLGRRWPIRGDESRAPAALIHHSTAALDWMTANTIPGGGLRVCAGAAEPYPEVTGYSIPTLMHWGEHERALQFATWLMTIQNPDGSWSDASAKSPYTFDTGQVLKGLIAVVPRLPQAEAAIRRGCDWLLTRMESTGRLTTPDTSAWVLPNGGVIDERIHLYVLSALRDAGQRFDEPRYERAVERALDYYLRDLDPARFATLSHFHAYVLEALVDLGHRDLAARGMAAVARHQRGDGAVPAYPDVEWVCSTGLAQFAVIWYKLGERAHADRAFQYLCRLQKSSGGFSGGYGRGANYFPNEEISWAVKYFLDACHWHVRSAFDADVAAFPATIADNDGRVDAVVRGMGDLSGLRVLDAGCGKGRFSRVLVGRYPSAEVWGVDLSDAMLRDVPSAIKTRQGTLLNLPFEDGHFDRVFSVEALEHSANPEAAVRELCRVLGSGGRIVVIDKNVERRGALRIEAWERWFEPGEVTGWLNRYCTDVRAEYIAYGDHVQPDGLFVAWSGVRR